MKRLIIVAEGFTEQTFINECLREPLAAFGLDVRSRIIGEPGRKGGIGWRKAQCDLELLLKGDRTCCVSTMFDFFRLPNDFPGMPLARELEPIVKAHILEDALLQWARRLMGDDWNTEVFVPYIQMHEFEAVVFSNPALAAQGLYRPDLESQLEAVASAFPSPEHINDGPDTAPSKQLQAIYPGYEKVTHGTLAALHIGLDGIRRRCAHFDEWFTRLEALGGS